VRASNAADTCILKEIVPLRNLAHAFLLSRFVPRYNRMAQAVKRDLLAGTTGDVLEIGAGTGANFGFFGEGVRWTGCDPNPAGRRYAERHAAAAGIPAEWHTAPAEQLPFDAGRFDCAVATLTLCSVREPEKALAEVLRVLRPGGQLLFLEHVRAVEGSGELRSQTNWAPVFRWVAGCRTDQDTAALVERAGFSSLEVRLVTLPLPVVSPHAAGRAVK